MIRNLCLYAPTLKSALFSTHCTVYLESSDNKNFWQLCCSRSAKSRCSPQSPTFCSQHCHRMAGLCWGKPERIFAPHLVECCQTCHTWASHESAGSVVPTNQAKWNIVPGRGENPPEIDGTGRPQDTKIWHYANRSSGRLLHQQHINSCQAQMEPLISVQLKKNST